MHLPLLDFFRFVYERQAIWHRRNASQQPWPWTNDEILQKFKFCNAYRELDACSQYLIHWVIENDELSEKGKIFNIMFYRRFNVLGFFDGKKPREPEEFKFRDWEEYLDEKKKTSNLFNDAYIICQRFYIEDYRKKEKHIQQLLLVRDLAEKMERIHHNLSTTRLVSTMAWQFQQTPLTGGFLAYQYLTDLSYLWPQIDINAYVDVGPGAAEGLKILYGEIPELEQVKRCKEIFEAQEQYFESLKSEGLNWDDVYYEGAYYKNKYLSLQNTQHCLCEYRKYFNLKSGKKCRHRFYKGARK